MHLNRPHQIRIFHSLNPSQRNQVPPSDLPRKSASLAQTLERSLRHLPVCHVSKSAKDFHTLTENGLILGSSAALALAFSCSCFRSDFFFSLAAYFSLYLSPRHARTLAEHKLPRIQLMPQQRTYLVSSDKWPEHSPRHTALCPWDYPQRGTTFEQGVPLGCHILCNETM